VKDIRLQQGNVYELSFPTGSFDFIYSLGMFGLGTRVTPELCAQFHSWLTPGGRMYFNATESTPQRRFAKTRSAVRVAVYPYLTSGLKRRIDARQAAPTMHFHTCAEVEQCMTAGGFVDFTLSTGVCRSHLWHGTHVECVAGRIPAARPATARIDLEFAAAVS
jgi:hypothetical protein